jgi:hypothetical protein
LSRRIPRLALGSLLLALLASAVALLMPTAARAQERPYFVTYSHEMEEPGNLEVAFKGVTGRPDGANRFNAANMEFEYGVKGWWTSELYLDGQSTTNESAVFSGFRLENRFRLLMTEHRINPVFYVEFENISSNKTLREVVGHDGQADLAEPNGDTRAEKKRELEMRLILSSNFNGWNFSENIIAEKNLTNEPWEFGYALATSRPLSYRAHAHPCAFCADKFTVGAEMYGGLGERYSFGLHETSHYAGPTVAWRAPGGYTISFSPQFGLNDYSVPRLYRFGVTYEIPQLFSHFRKGGPR